MAQESWKLEKDETDCELLKPPSSSPSPAPPPPPPPQPQSPPPICAKSPAAAATSRLGRPTADSDAAASGEVESPKRVRFMNRCSSCQKKVGLAGFRCRCGDLFCGRHRYSDTHDCSFDYKSAGREEIAKANPVVRAAKIIKI